MRRFLVFLLKLVAASIVVLGLAGVAVYYSDPVFWQRLVTQPRADAYKAVDWYSPLEAVEGFETEIPQAGVASRSIAASALDEAERYAAENDSVALVVYHKGAIQLEKYWPGFGRATRTETASLHKGVVGLLYGIALDEGHIGSIDDPIGKYLEEWSHDPRGRITIRNLLQMRSGLEAPISSASPFSAATQLHMGTDIRGVVFETPLVSEPGAQFQYNDVDAQLLGLILERATGERYARYLSTRLWSQIGAPTAYVWLDRTAGMARTYCCLQATARGWLQVGRMILARGRSPDDEQVVPEQWIVDATTPTDTNANFGYQLRLGPTPGVVFLDGAGGQRVYVVPAQELVIVRTGRPQREWDDSRLVNIILRGLGPDAR